MKIRLLFFFLFLTACATAPVAAPAATNTPPPAQVEAPVVVQVSTATPTQFVVDVTPNLPEPTATQSPPVASVNDQCNNPYYPIVDGATWEYQLSSGGSAAHALTVSEDLTFTILVTGAETTFRIEGQCLEEGIVLMDTGMSTTAQGDSGSGGIIATNQEGLTIPHDIQLGDDWLQTIGFTSELFSGTIETSYVAAAYESVMVPAGTFEALRLEQTSTTTMNGYNIESKSTLWYAAGVGNVKSEIEGPGGEPTIVQLVAYNIP